MGLTQALADAITRQEGFFPGSVSYQANNPGNIMDLAYYKQTGKFRVQTYATLEEGRAALEKLIDNYIAAGHTLTSFFAKYAPSGHGDNNVNTYVNNVASWLSIPTDVPLAQISQQVGEGVGVTDLPVGDPVAPNVSTSSAGGVNLPLLALMGAAGAAIWWWLGD